MEEDGGLNLYLVAGNNMITEIDILGLANGTRPKPGPPPAPNNGGSGDVHHSELTLTLTFKPCCADCKKLLAEIYAHLKSFDLWGNNSVASLSISGNIGTFTPGYFAESGSQLFAGDDPGWQVQFSYDDQGDVVSARTLNDHPLVGVRKWSASSSSQGGNYVINISTEAYDRVRNWQNGILGSLPIIGGRKDQLQIWQDYFNNFVTAYKSNPCFESEHEQQYPTSDTGSTSNPWLQ